MRLSAGSTIARACSGSRSSISSIDPLMSANNAVTVFRSPSMSSEVRGDSLSSSELAAGKTVAALAAVAASAVPQSPQNRFAGGLSAPHLGQQLASGAPQSPQNFLPAGLSLPHFEQRIFPRSANYT